jgi:hypothetical protein
LEARREQARSVLPHDKFEELCNLLVTGIPLPVALNRHQLAHGAFWRTISTPWAKTLWDETKRAAALAMMENVRERALRCCDASPNNPVALATLGKVTAPIAKAYDSATWGDKMQIDQRQLVIHTNLDFRVCETLEGIIASMPEIDTEP